MRRFLRKRGSDDLPTVTEEELIRYTVTMASHGVRKKTLSALESFFAYAESRGHVGRDPARFLWQAVHRALEDRALVNELTHAGLPTDAAADLSWRDIAYLTLAPPPAPAHALELSAELHRRLAGMLLKQLQSTTPDDLDRVLESRVIGDGGTGFRRDRFARAAKADRDPGLR
ncbi:MAG: hypothetical protein JO036_12710 [Candidatus Eremiobacteraeota bacterium]|nr:hypothetical protein [Candidatus Eremiobacteraeota bacterium]